MKDILNRRIKRLPRKEFQEMLNKFYVYNNKIYSILRIIPLDNNLFEVHVHNKNIFKVQMDYDTLMNKSLFPSKNQLFDFIKLLKEKIELKKREEDNI